MSEAEQDVPVDASAAKDRDEWLALMDRIGAEEGYFRSLGPRHWAMFIDDGPNLIVSFETLEGARARQGQMPLLHGIAAAKGWSHLCLIADGPTWFRDSDVWAFFDELVDDAFFEDFDSVAFYGAGTLAHAACAYSVTSPGARVLALAPAATLDPALTAWDERHKRLRRLDFNTRYGFAPDMTEGADRLWVICDPQQRLDLAHAALFRGSQTTLLPMRYAGPDIETTLARLGILDKVIIAAAEGSLTPRTFAGHWRKRVDDGSYLRALLHAIEVKGNRRRAIALCENVVRRLKLSRFRKKLADLRQSIPGPAENRG